VTVPEPTHSTPRPRPNPSSTRARPPCPLSLDARAQGPRAGELLSALALVAPAYINPRRSNEETHTTPSYSPNIISPSLSLWFVDACNAGEVLDTEGAAAFDLPGASRRWELEEELRRSLFCTPPSSSASSPSRRRRRIVVPAPPVSPNPSHEDDASEPLDRDRSVAYRFGKVK
jgi:hypothetical protein